MSEALLPPSTLSPYIQPHRDSTEKCPYEVVLMIFRYLGALERIKAGEVCQLWFHASRDESLWRIYCAALGFAKQEEGKTWYQLGCAQMRMQAFYDGEIVTRKARFTPCVRKQAKEVEKFRIERSSSLIEIFDRKTNISLFSCKSGLLPCSMAEVIDNYILMLCKNSTYEIWNFASGRWLATFLNVGWIAHPQLYHQTFVFEEFADHNNRAICVCFLDRSKEDFAFKINKGLTAIKLMGNTLAMAFDIGSNSEFHRIILVDIEKKQIMTAGYSVPQRVRKMEWEGPTLNLFGDFIHDYKLFGKLDLSKKATGEKVETQALVLREHVVNGIYHNGESPPAETK